MGILSWGMATFYDAMMSRAETASLGAWRKDLFKNITGDVLEIGAGTGVNLHYYSDVVTRLTLTEPDQQMRRKLENKLADMPFKHEIIAATAEALPFPDQSFDAVVSTLVLCSVVNQEKSLRELHRVLKPAGKLALIEHVVDPQRQNIYKWQKRIEPFWKRCAGNCHLTRDSLLSLQMQGFDCTGVKQDIMSGAVFFVSPAIHGIAEKTE